MKILLSITFLFLFQSQLFGQELNSSFTSYDSSLVQRLRSRIENTNNDSIKARTLNTLSWAIEGFNADSALFVAKQAYEISKKSNNKTAQIYALRAVAYNQGSLGNYGEALKSLLLAFEILGYPFGEENNTLPKINGTPEDQKILEYFAEIHRDMGHLLSKLGNYEEQLNRYKIALKIHKALNNNERIIANTTFNIAQVYLSTNQLDSAIVLAKKSLEYYEKENIEFYASIYLGVIYNIIGEAYLTKKEYTLAEDFLFKAERANYHYKNWRNLVWSQLYLSKLFLEKQDYNTSLKYASKARVTAIEVGLKGHIARTYSSLAECYQALNKQDSGYYYLMLATPLLDSLQQSEKNNLVRYQNILYAENQNLYRSEQEKTAAQNRNRIFSLLGTVGFILLIAVLLFRNNRQKQKANHVLETTLENLKSTQSQLVQSEKMASLGELTAGIAHEIQNPLNFVNNFSEVSSELIDEMKAELATGNLQPANEIADDVKSNLEKILHHGKRADAIVKGMLQHSKSSSGKKEATDINVLCDEYLRLAYHGLRAKDKSFNAKFETDFDTSLEKINVVPQDIGRVILNLITNAFYATSLRQAQGDSGYEPTVIITTKHLSPSGGGKGEVIISVKDNGNGIPDSIKEKIFQPFFTTKPTGQGTGLGLSLSYDIVKAHGGEIKVETKEEEGSEFVISMPLV